MVPEVFRTAPLLSINPPTHTTPTPTPLPQDMNAMIDAAKYADLVLLMVDGGFGFEMETFEFLNICQVGWRFLLDISCVDG